MSIKNFIKFINAVQYSEINYKEIIDSLYKTILYIKNPPINLFKVNFIKELNEMNTANITFFKFFNSIQKIRNKLKDLYFTILFKKRKKK